MGIYSRLGQLYDPVDADNFLFYREAKNGQILEEGITADLGDGRQAVVPGTPQRSELFRRITADDVDERMPPIDSHKHLEPEQIRLLKNWILQGATWEDHWSFTGVQRPDLPSVSNADWPANPIDRFVLRRLEQEGLAPSNEADKQTLIRRVSFDTTGLPPSEALIKTYVEDASPQAYEKMIDRLLASKKYGEHRARYWLDAARYGDTHGFHLDNYRGIWPYRDWVVQAYNNNMPFDQFTVEQLAGDLLPNATQSQKVATGFNRCNPTTSEGGAIAEEYLSIYAKDRVETTSTVWLGLTLGCAACHDHKFDPLSQKDFYQMAAFFRNTTQAAMDQNIYNTPPSIRVYGEEQRKTKVELESEIAEINTFLSELLPTNEIQRVTADAGSEWVAEDALELGIALTESEILLTTRKEPIQIAGTHRITSVTEEQVLAIPQDAPLPLGDFANFQMEQPFTVSFWLFFDDEVVKEKPAILFGRNDKDEGRHGWHVVLGKDHKIELKIVSDAPQHNRLNLKADTALKTNEWNHVFLSYDTRFLFDVVRNFQAPFAFRVNDKGAKIKGVSTKSKFRGSIQVDQPFVLGEKRAHPKLEQVLAIRDLRIFDQILSQPEQQLLASGAPTEENVSSNSVSKIVAVVEGSNTLASIEPKIEPIKENTKQLRKAEWQLAQLKHAAPITLVMEEKKDTEPEAHILNRGEYDQPGERVTPGVPDVFPPLPAGDKTNRLTLARWLVDPANPLTARVNANRMWQELFGVGIVKTAEDFGSQGEPPTHLELLDWLAAEFVDSGWDVKHMYKTMLMSATYKQSSRVRPELLKTDPGNRLLARGPRHRLDAEVIRDQALYLGDLLVEQLGGPPVKPYQPQGVWKAVAYTGSNMAVFEADQGASLYRRSLYTLWKRTAPPPSMAIFDAPSRESCSVRRERTNTPLQALVLMNDPQYVEAARNFAQLVLNDSSADKFKTMLTRALGCEPTQQVTDILKQTYEKILPIYQEDAEAANKLIRIGESTPDESIDPVELATWTMVANQVMNLDAFINKN